MSVDGLTKDQLVILKELLRGKPVTVSVTRSEKAGNYKLLFHKDMEPMIQKGLLQECILANGQNHSKVAEAVAFDVSYKRNLYDQAIQNTREHYYILSENKEVLEVTPNGCAYLGEDGKYILDKKDVQYKERSMQPSPGCSGRYRTVVWIFKSIEKNRKKKGGNGI